MFYNLQQNGGERLIVNVFGRVELVGLISGFNPADVHCHERHNREDDSERDWADVIHTLSVSALITTRPDNSYFVK